MTTQHAFFVRFLAGVLGLGLAGGLTAASEVSLRDTRPDTWTAVDALGRVQPRAGEARAPRADKFVGVFYFLWAGQHGTGGPYDITRILAAHPEAVTQPDHPAWGPAGQFHHWGEPLFGYYLSDDRWVLRRHARMLADAGVDVVIFDVSNQATYRKCYEALGEAFLEVRRQGGRTPQFAFLCPFWEPAATVRKLYAELYEPGRFAELWFRWQGRPLILADPARLGKPLEWLTHESAPALQPGGTLGQTFTAPQAFTAVSACFPTYQTAQAGVRLTLRREGPGGAVVAERAFARVTDNAWLALPVAPVQPPGVYYLEAAAPQGRIGWWSTTNELVPGGQAWADGVPAAGDRALRLDGHDPSLEALRQFFTFRKPQPDYFIGPTGPDQWSWLEVFPQHVFTNAQGQAEQMAVGVGQNARHGRLAAFSQSDTLGRSWHNGRRDTQPGAVARGLNLAEQSRRALEVDPSFLFLTGWNEWIASRFSEFNGVREPVMFVDQFSQEGSRDAEPMRGGHGDNYYYQMTDLIRRFKGVRTNLVAGPPATIKADGDFQDWAAVQPEHLDDAGDVDPRDHPGYDGVGRYTDRTGRNDFVSLKVARDARRLAFYVRTRQPITPREGESWMLLYLDSDADPRTGWEGFEYRLNRRALEGGQASVERYQSGGWRAAGGAQLRVAGAELELVVERKVLEGSWRARTPRFDFKWVDNAQNLEDPLEWTVHGDTAPNARFRYRYEGARSRE